MYRDEEDVAYRDRLEEVDRQNRRRMTEGVLNLLGVLFGIVCILVLSALLISLLDWLKTDISSTFLEHSLKF